MTNPGTEELVLVALSPDPSPTDHSITDLTDRLGIDSLSGRVDLVTTLENLREAGAVERIERESDDNRTRVKLTESGRERAESAVEELSNVEIVVDNGDRREVTLAAAAAELDRSLVSVASDLSEEGIYYVGEVPAIGFVDRNAERERFEEVLSTVRDRSVPKAVVVTGPPGVGKTTLSDRFVEDATDWHSLRAQVEAAGGPYRPVRDLLAADGTDPATVFSGDGPEVEDLTELAAQRSALFESVLDALCPPDAERPRLLYFDDFHHADQGTVAFVRYLLERANDRPVAVLACIRPGERLDEIWTEIGTDAEAIAPNRVERLELAAFDRGCVRELIEREVGRRGAPEGLVDAVYERTDGNPLFVVETVASLLDTDQLHRSYEWYPETADDIDLPTAVEAVVDTRVRQFDDQARDLLRWAAAAGEQVSLSVLRAVTDVDHRTLSNYLDGMVAAGLVELIDGTDDRRVAFHSEVVRDVIDDGLDDQEKRRRHEAIAEALADRTECARAERAAKIGYNYRRAGAVGASVEWFRLAADRALAVYAHETALQHLHDALEIARDHDEGSVVDLATTVASVHETLGEYEKARRYGKFARKRASTPDERRQALVQLARIAMNRGNNERAKELANEGLAVDDDEVSDELDCKLLDTLANTQRQLGQYDAARESARRQRDLAASEDYPELLAQSLKTLGVVSDLQSDYDAARERYERSKDAFEAAGNRHGAGKAVNNLGLLAALQNDYEAARDHLEESLSVFRSIGARRDVARSLTNLGMVAFREGELDAARERFEESAELERSMGAKHGIGATLNNLGMVTLEQGDYESAKEYLQESLETCRSIGDRHGAGKALNNLGRVAISRGNHGVARDHLEEALDIYDEVGAAPHDVATTRTHLGEIEHQVGNIEASFEYYESALSTFREADAPHDVAEAQSILAKLEHERGNAAKAVERLEEAESLALDVGDDGIVAACRALHGVVCWDQGERETAIEDGNRAIESIEAANNIAIEGLQPMVPLIELANRAVDAGEPDAVDDWCDRVLAVLDEGSKEFDDFRQQFRDLNRRLTQ